VIENKPDPEVETEAARRLAEALDPSVIDALLADAKIAGTRSTGVDGLLNQMTKADLLTFLWVSFRDRRGVVGRVRRG
jgi:putative transposase